MTSTSKFLFYAFLWMMSPILLMAQKTDIEMAVFEVDVTPPIGSPVAYAPARSIQDPLSARGIVIQSEEGRVVLCAVDWIGISNESQDRFKQALANAAGTTKEKVSVHALHQHDGVRCDHTSAKLLAKYGLEKQYFDLDFMEKSISNVALGVAEAVQHLVPVTHVGFGQAKVDSVASNRRILGEDGKVKIIRFSKSKDPAAIAAPEGVIDPFLKMVTFWNKKNPIVAMTYYATHPQSYYGQGDVTCEFVGIARNNRQTELGIPHIHFTGAAGNVAAGKYNDGSEAMRPVLTTRMEKAMAQSWEKTKKKRLKSKDVQWKSLQIELPVSEYLQADFLVDRISGRVADPDLSVLSAAKHLAWLNRTQAGHKTTVSALKVGNIQLLNLPGEIFVEYQLAAQSFQPKQQICTAAYEEYGPGYIGTKIAYGQGGYETSNRASRVSGDAEAVLLQAIEKVLD